MPSQVKRAFAEDGANPTYIGGQAIIEGVMMRGRTCWAYAIRRPDGTMASGIEDLTPKKKDWRTWPFIRGCFALAESLSLGFKALELSASIAFPEDENAQPAESKTADASKATEEDELTDRALGESMAAGEDNAPCEDNTTSTDKQLSENVAADTGKLTEESGLSKFEMGLSLVLGVALAIVLFVVVPGVVAQLVVGDYGEDSLAWNLLDGVAKGIIFILYAWGIGKISDIRRLYAYHGAEHQSIHCLEHNEELTPENAQNYPRLHVRCGTAFLLMVILVSIVLYCVLPIEQLVTLMGITGTLPVFLTVLLIRILLLPLIVGVTYEITVKWAGAHSDSKLVRLIMWPGLQMQRLTTNEPDADMLECAICALQLVRERECNTP